MLDLPLELQDIILSLLETKDLWVLVRVSRPFRQLALSPLLLRYDIPVSQVYSGSVCLPAEAYFLIPMIYHIHSIQQLTILSRNVVLPLQGIPFALAAVPLIPDVMISGPTHTSQDPNVARLIAALSRNGRDPVALVGMGTIRVSRHRRVAPLQLWKAPTVRFSKLTLKEFFLCFIYCVPLLIYFIFLGIVNPPLLLAWLCRHLVGRPWDQSHRIAADLKWMYGSSLHVQTICVPGATQFTLATFAGDVFSTITISALPALSFQQFTALLATLDLKDNISALTVKTGCALSLPTLLTFVRRHRLLQRLTIEPGAIHSATLPVDTVPSTDAGRLTTLTAPAPYIPYILPAEPSVADLTITSASDGPQLARALAAIAASANPNLARKLNLNFGYCGRTRGTLPWRESLDPEAVAPLSGVRHLTLRVQFHYGPADMLGLPRWLAQRFPALLSLELRGQAMPVEEQTALMQAIREARIGVNADEWEGVYFNG
ncbi:hypothetical protein B0H19DRAFT_1257938 [Mycena capillaripes]|nr:hypothetical protein B0H19DRAFT_1257938 [Mycena capillaripes]